MKCRKIPEKRGERGVFRSCSVQAVVVEELFASWWGAIAKDVERTAANGQKNDLPLESLDEDSRRLWIKQDVFVDCVVSEAARVLLVSIDEGKIAVIGGNTGPFVRQHATANQRPNV
jgi:hypothetical protein